MPIMPNLLCNAKQASKSLAFDRDTVLRACRNQLPSVSAARCSARTRAVMALQPMAKTSCQTKVGSLAAGNTTWAQHEREGGDGVAASLETSCHVRTKCDGAWLQATWLGHSARTRAVTAMAKASCQIRV